MPLEIGSLRFTKGMDAPLSATVARQSCRIGRASDGGSEGMASRDLYECRK